MAHVQQLVSDDLFDLIPGAREAPPAAQPLLDVGLVHDYVTQRGGAERVVLAMAQGLGLSTVETSLYNLEGTYPEFSALHMRTSALQAVPAFRRDPRLAAPLLARVFGNMDLRDHEVVLCSTSGWSHGVKARRKVAYCYTPARWLYEPQDYYRSTAARVGSRLASRGLDQLRMWDQDAARGVDRYLTLSTTLAARIRRVYGVEATVVPPPVSIDVTGPEALPHLPISGPYLLTISRARAYKNTASVVEAMRHLPDLQLVIVGEDLPGTQQTSDVERRATGLGDRSKGRRVSDRVVRAGRVSDDELRWLYRNCEAVVSASNEDFGLTPLEGNAYGKPSVTLRAGGFLDTVVEDDTGTFFDSLDPSVISEAVDRALRLTWSWHDLERNVVRFGSDRFAGRLAAVLAEVAATPARNANV